MLRRREFIASSLISGLMPSAVSAQTCAQTCVAEVNLNHRFYASQRQSEWCWAASISMIFAYHGHPVDQLRIVNEAYGGPYNMPAMPIMMSQSLNRRWLDDNRIPFRANLLAAYDQFAGVMAISDNFIINSLENDEPLVIGARTHAMVMTAVEYLRTPYGVQIVNAGVFDPWPGIGKRQLQRDELVPAFRGGSLFYLASISVN